MQHFRVLAFLVVATAALALPVAATTAPVDQVKGPACGDITLLDNAQSGVPIYRTFGGAATVFASLTTAKPSCAKATYTITVYDAAGTTQLSTQTYVADDTTSIFQSSYVPSGIPPQQLCIAAASSRDGKVIDAAPNSGCFLMTLDVGSSGGGSGLN